MSEEKRAIIRLTQEIDNLHRRIRKLERTQNENEPEQTGFEHFSNYSLIIEHRGMNYPGPAETELMRRLDKVVEL